MEIKGKVIAVGEIQTGTAKSTGNEWKKQTFVIEEIEGQYPKQIAMDAFNKDFTMNIGDVITAHINIESREYNGKWYTNIGLWKFEVTEAVPTSETQIPEASTAPPEDEDELPF